MRKIFTTILLILVFSSISFAQSTYQTVINGKTCKEDSMQRLVCKYIIGKSLEIWITGIGMPAAGITFARSDFYNGDYYATYGLLHGCIIIKNGSFILDMAFISPRNGKVYQDWITCKNDI